jgi:hypothetical protein
MNWWSKINLLHASAGILLLAGVIVVALMLLGPTVSDPYVQLHFC